MKKKFGNELLVPALVETQLALVACEALVVEVARLTLANCKYLMADKTNTIHDFEDQVVNSAKDLMVVHDILLGNEWDAQALARVKGEVCKLTSQVIKRDADQLQKLH